MTIQRYTGENVDFHATGDLVAYGDYAELKEEYERLDKSHSAALAKIDALAAENALFKQDYMKTPALRGKGWPKTPATDAILASLRAEGVQIYAEKVLAENMMLAKKAGMETTSAVFAHLKHEAESFAAQLRSKSEVQS
jgi:hypothetical protein